MRVLITGGTGLIGKAATQHLLANGGQVRVFDLPERFDNPAVEYIQGDILNYDQVFAAMQGCDGVIHLAALRHVNVTGTFNVFEAAAKFGIQRVVQASSINAIGGFYNTLDLDIRYFPIDEDHPRLTTDPYSFSKQMVEDIGVYYWRRAGISSVALRFPAVFPVGFTETESYQQRTTTILNVLAELMSLPEAERVTRIAEAARQVLAYRQHRPFEFQPDESVSPFKHLYDDPLFGTYIVDRFNFWAYVDERDAAQALAKGLTADYTGAHPLFVNASCNSLNYDSRTLLRLFFPEVNHFTTDLSGTDAILSIDRARALLGFEPEFSDSLSRMP
jgi:nucleoside-diphosphate-sugar epimerase